MPKIPSEQFTGKIIKVLFDTYNELGFGYQEKYYYRAIRLKLLALGLQVQEQLLTKIFVESQIIGRYFLDFLISDANNKVVLELKVADQVYPQHVRQVLGYLTANNLKLGLIGVFTTHGVKIKRVIN
jgi:GxxExxY protein